MYIHSYSGIKSKVLLNSSCHKQGGAFACYKQDLLVAGFEAVNPTTTSTMCWPCFKGTYWHNCAYHNYVCKAFLEFNSALSSCIVLFRWTRCALTSSSGGSWSRQSLIPPAHSSAVSSWRISSLVSTSTTQK